MKQTSELEGIVLSVQDYKENDGIVKLLMKEKVVSILAKGIQKPTSKNRRICIPFTKVRYYVDVKEMGLSVLYHGEILYSYHHVMDSLVASSICFCLSELILKTSVYLDLFEYYEECLKYYHKKNELANNFACLVLREILLSEGIAPFVDGCVLCGRVDSLETISVEAGGFICSVCNHGHMLTRSKAELIQIRSLFKVTKDKLNIFNSMYIFSVDDIIYWIEWFEKYMHLSVQSLSFLRSVRSLK